jgi:hypothetical protein
MSADPEQSFRLTVGTFLGSYRVLRPLSADADGELYLAKTSSRQTTVLLRLFPVVATASDSLRASLAERCETAAGLQHPGLARCTSLQSDRGLWFTAFELPDGPRGEPMTLASALSESGGRLPEERVALLAEHLCKALHYAHQFRGQGLAHGRLSLDSIYLTAQRQPRVVDLRLVARADPMADLRAMGAVFSLLLVGARPDVGSVPSAPGLNRRWDRLVRSCLGAGAAGGFASVDDLAKALQSREASGFGAVIWAVVLGILVLAIAGGAFALLRYRSGRLALPAAATTERKPTPAVPAPAVASAASQRGEVLRATVDQCMAVNDLEGAEQALSEWAQTAPADPEVRQRLGTVRAQRGAQAVGAIKQAAEAAFSQAIGIREADDLEAKIEALKAIRQEAAGHLAAMRFDDAAAAYRRLRTEAEALTGLDTARADAAAARNAAGELRETAQTAGAEKDAGEAWQAAETAWSQGGELYADLRFSEATKAFRLAGEGFGKAAKLASGGRALAAAQAKFEDEKARAGDTLMGRLPAGVTEQLAAMAREAETAQASGQPAAAAVLWAKAEVTLAAALDAVAAAGARPAKPSELFRRPGKGNLVLNGDLEKGADGQPDSWSRMDGLTTFWEAKGNPGSCLRLDTNVQQADKKRQQADPEGFKGKTQGDQYATVGAHEGVWAFPAPIPVLPTDQYFLIEVDCMGPAKSSSLMYPQVLIRGFRQFDPEKDAGTFSWFQTPHEGGPDFSEQFGKAQRRAQPGDYLMIWRHALVCRNSAPSIWEHYRLGLKLPDDPRFRPDTILLKAYAMWPLGEYRFDNLSMRVASREEYEKAKAEGHSIEGFMPLE